MKSIGTVLQYLETYVIGRIMSPTCPRIFMNFFADVESCPRTQTSQILLAIQFWIQIQECFDKFLDAVSGKVGKAKGTIV